MNRLIWYVIPLLLALSGCVYIDATVPAPPAVVYYPPYTPPSPTGAYVPPAGDSPTQRAPIPLQPR
jgi:hypothetical protein